MTQFAPRCGGAARPALLIAFIAVALVRGEPVDEHDETANDMSGKDAINVDVEELCQACRTTVQAAFDFVAVYAENQTEARHEKGQMLPYEVNFAEAKKISLSLEPEYLRENLCKANPFPYFHKRYLYVCANIVSKYQHHLFKVVTGRKIMDSFNTGAVMYEHMRDFCSKDKGIGFCPGKLNKEGEEQPKNMCEACQVLTNDLYRLINREKYLTLPRIRSIFRRLCHQIPVRHRRTSLLVEVCTMAEEDHMEMEFMARDWVRPKGERDLAKFVMDFWDPDEEGTLK